MFSTAGVLAHSFLKPGVAAQKVKPSGKNVDIQELQFIASQKGMWARYNAKNGSRAQVSSTQWFVSLPDALVTQLRN